MATPTPQKQATPTVAERDRQALLAQGGIENPRTREITMPDGRVLQPSGNGAYTVKAQPTQTPRPTATVRPTETAKQKVDNEEELAAERKARATPTAIPDYRKQFTDIGAVPLRSGVMLFPQPDGSLQILSEDPKSHNMESHGKGYTSTEVADEWLKELFPKQPDLLKQDSDAWPDDVKRRMDEVHGRIPASILDRYGGIITGEVGGPAHAEPPTSDLSRPEPPDVLDEAEQRQILGQNRTSTSNPGAADQGGNRPSTSAKRQPVENTRAPEKPWPTGYRSWENDSGQTGGSSNQYYTDKNGNQRSVGGGGGIATGPAHNWAYSYPQGQAAFFRPDLFGGQRYAVDPNAYLQNDPTHPYSGQGDPEDPYNYGYPPDDTVFGFKGGGHTVVPEKSVIMGLRSGRVYGTVGEERPELATSHPDGSVSIENHVPGMGRYASGGSLWGPGAVDRGPPPLDPETAIRAYLDSLSPGERAAQSSGLQGFLSGKQVAPEWYSASGDFEDPNAGGPSRIYQLAQRLLDSRGGDTMPRYAGGGTLTAADPNNPQITKSPQLFDPSAPATSAGSGGFSGTSFPGTTIGGYAIPGLNAGSLPTSTLPWNGQGNIPQGLDVNALENQSANTISGLQNYQSGFNRDLQGVYGSINSAEADIMRRQSEAEKNDSERLNLQHLYDVYDPYRSKAGLPKPQERNPDLGVFGVPSEAASTSGTGPRWALLSPVEVANRIRQPLSQYQELIGKTASGVATQISDAMTNARNIIAALNKENPSKANPYGTGLVPQNQYPTGANLTPQQQANDDAALLRAKESLEPGQTGTITLPSGLTVTYAGSKGQTPQQRADDDAALLKAEMALEQGQTGSIRLPSGTTVTYSGRKPKADDGGGSGGGGGSRPPAAPKKPTGGQVSGAQKPQPAGSYLGGGIFAYGTTPAQIAAWYAAHPGQT